MSEFDDYEHIIKVLLPIRKERLHKIERIEREQKKSLNKSQELKAETEEALEKKIFKYKEICRVFNDKNLGLQSYTKLISSLDKEDDAKKTVLENANRVSKLQSDVEQKQAKVLETAFEKKMRLRDVEKIESLLDVIKELS
ncbi:hypothetical protein H2241_04125 [Pantoea ananatis]|nr:hypothetical protein [Pantoea ananatis]MBA4820174.1 hypothetical protein [Pantoea ananatis]